MSRHNQSDPTRSRSSQRSSWTAAAKRYACGGLGVALASCGGQEATDDDLAPDALIRTRIGKAAQALSDQPPKPATSPTRIRGYLAASVRAQPTSNPDGVRAEAPTHDVYLPGVTVNLRDRATGTTVASVKTDLSGRFNFEPEPRGSYDVCWTGKTLAAGCAPNSVTLSDHVVHIGTIRVPSVQTNGSVPVWGKVTLGNGALPRMLEPLANINAFARVTLLGKNGAVLDRVNVNNFGEYFLPLVPVNQNISLRANYEAAQALQPIDAGANLGGASEHRIDLSFSNRPPRLAELTARDMSGARVRVGTPGATVLLAAEATEPDGDALKYHWQLGASDGVLSDTTSPTVKWTLPTQEGEYTVSVVVSDGAGGYAKSTLPLAVHTSGVLFAGHVGGTDSADVSGAEVSVNGASTLSDASGNFRLFVREVDRYVVNIQKRSYGLYSKVYDDGVSNGRFTLTRASVQTVDPRLPIDVSNRRLPSDCPGALSSTFAWAERPDLLEPQWQDGKNNVIPAPRAAREVVLPRPNPERPRECGPGVRVQIPANGLVDANGSPPPGLVDVELATIDLGSPEQMPGDQSVRMPDGSIKVMNSYGAGSFEFWSGNTRYNLRHGVAATVIIPIDARQRAAGGPPPASIPFLYYNEKRGEWYPEGTLSLIGGSYQGTAKHFSVINADTLFVNQACIDVHSPLLPSTYLLEVTIPLGPGVAPKVLQYYIDNRSPSRHVIYNATPNTNVTLVPYDPVTRVPFGVFVVNTGGVQNPTVPNLPVNYDACSSDVTLTPIALQQDPSNGEFLHGLYSFAATNLTELSNTGPAGAQLVNELKLASGAYYKAADPDGLRDTLTKFRKHNGFATNEIQGVYANGGDLGFGRDMRCVKNGNNVACMVTNYGNNTTDDQADADAALNGLAPVATVAMEYSPIEKAALPDPVVKFFVYDNTGARVVAANLDGKGDRPVPQLCMVCHGGELPQVGAALPAFADAEDADLGAVFLPFDLAYYKFPTAAGWDKASQQAAFKSLNDIVLATNPTPAIQEVILGMYANGSGQQDENFTVAGWSAEPAQSAMYESDVAHTCRTCHAALPDSSLHFATAAQMIDRLGAIETRVCEQHVMPHSLVTHNLFWNSINPNMVAALQVFGDTYKSSVNGWDGSKCGEHTAGGTTPLGVFATTIQPVFAEATTNRCTSCHVSNTSPGGLNLTAAVAHSNLVNKASTQLPTMDRIKPGNVALSYLLHKIKNTHGTVGGAGSKMPLGGNMSQSDIQILEAWVNAGAPP